MLLGLAHDGAADDDGDGFSLAASGQLRLRGHLTPRKELSGHGNVYEQAAEATAAGT